MTQVTIFMRVKRVLSMLGARVLNIWFFVILVLEFRRVICQDRWRHDIDGYAVP